MSDTREIADTRGGGGVQPHAAAAERFAQTLTMVREAMLNPDVDANKAKVMSELMTSLEDRSMQAEFNRDLNRAIMEMPVITKAGIITIPAKDGKPERTQGRFARFEDIDRVVRPILQRHNLAIRFEIDESPKGVSVRPILSHANGHTERGGAMHSPLDTSGAKNNVQGAGSAVSYCKRYTMCAALNIITEGTDDDGSLGKYAIDMPHEREVAVLEQAEEAAAAGNYPTWYGGQGVKDRAWLVSSGHHVRLGGDTPALPGRTPTPPPPVEPERKPAPSGKRTAEQMADDFVAGINAQKTPADLAEYQALDARVTWLAKLAEQRPDLHDRITAAGQAKGKALMAALDDGGGDARENDNRPAPSGGLFEETDQ